jgi:putative transposase
MAAFALTTEAPHRKMALRTSPPTQAEIAFLGMESSPSFVRQPECNGCVERFIRTLKEQLLWVRVFQNVEELRCALAEFRERYNQRWIVQRLGYLTPAQARQQILALGAAA